MYVDHRTYTLKPLKLPKWLALYEQYGLPVQTKYLGNLIGFFQGEIGTLNQVVHLWGFDDLNERQRRRAEMGKDPAWHEFLRRNEELGALMHQESKILIPVSFSPIK
ncbi:MAG: NIPSNAP family protein [Bradyrhizobium sp.]|nr:NIPSNAP family protein [Bradyrhizobium sp.]